MAATFLQAALKRARMGAFRNSSRTLSRQSAQEAKLGLLAGEASPFDLPAVMKIFIFSG